MESPSKIPRTTPVLAGHYIVTKIICVFIVIGFIEEILFILFFILMLCNKLKMAENRK